MFERVGDLWDFYDNGEWIVITTNGTVKKNGEAVMGRGCALEAKTKYPQLPLELGNYIRNNGNRVFIVQDFIMTLPVKHNWYEKANLKLIETSLQRLVDNVSDLRIPIIFMPRPGCGNGHLDWESQVKPLCEKYLDDRFVVLTK
jgi:hypothetical protein